MKGKRKIAVVLGCFAICGVGAIVQCVVHLGRATVRPAELYDTVWRQVEAFREADYPRAYQQVSTSFQERFNIETFADLARTDYPAIVRAERMEFGAVRFEGRHALVHVYFFRADGEVIPCIYKLVREDGHVEN